METALSRAAGTTVDPGRAMEKSQYKTVRSMDDFYSTTMKNVPLLELDLELTRRCNNSCVHCYNNLPEKSREAQEAELTTGQWANVLGEATELGCLTVMFTGGEPLLRPDFPELYLCAKKLGFKISVFTNGTLITREVVELFEKYPPGLPVEITVYGMTEESCERVTGWPGSFELMMNGIKLLTEADIPMVVKGAFPFAELGEIDRFDRWARRLPHMQNTAPALAVQFDLRVCRDSESRNRKISQLRPGCSRLLQVLGRDRKGYLLEMKEFCGKFLAVRGDRLLECRRDLRHFAIDSEGSCSPCLLLRHPGLSENVLGGGLKTAMDAIRSKVSGLTAKNEDYLNRCARCFLQGLCRQCAGRSWIEHGTLDTPVQYHCETAHCRARDLSLLREGEKAWEVTDWQRRIALFQAREL
jgi:MoaA/NifB/PqqE/SkfB family radical SAM enzyme